MSPTGVQEHVKQDFQVSWSTHVFWVELDTEKWLTIVNNALI